MLSSRASAPRRAKTALKVPRKERIDARMGVAGSGRMRIVYQRIAPEPGAWQPESFIISGLRELPGD